MVSNANKNREAAATYLTPGLWQEVKIHCAKKGIKLQDFVEKCLRQGLKCKEK